MRLNEEKRDDACALATSEVQWATGGSGVAGHANFSGEVCANEARSGWSRRPRNGSSSKKS